LLPWLQKTGLKSTFKAKFQTKVNLSFGLQEGQPALTGQRAANFRLLANQ